MSLSVCRKPRIARQELGIACRKPGLKLHKAGKAQARRVASLGLLFVLVCLSLTSCRAGLTTEQKLEDFRYLFEILRDNYPYLQLKVRSEGYDWLSHEKEFEQAVRNSRDDKEFAQAIQRMLLMLNNGHTSIVNPRIYELFSNLPPEMKPWKDQASKTDAKTVSRWYGYVSNLLEYPKGQTLPFRAWYCQGEYVVYWVADGLQSEKGIAPGDVLVSVNGTPVHEFVRSLRGLVRLRLDPIRSRMYLNDFLPPYTGQPYEVEFRQPDGKLVQALVGFEKATGPKRTPQLPTLLGRTDNLYTTMLADGRAAYLHIKQMTSYEQAEEDAKALRKFFAEIQEVPVLIIDIRGNGGGDDRFWMLNIVRPLATRPLTKVGGATARMSEFLRPFQEANANWGMTIEGLTGTGRIISKAEIPEVITAEQLENLPPELLGPDFGPLFLSELTILPSDEYPYRGKVFLLVDYTVYSAAQGFAEFCKGSGWATVVGEHTGGGNDGSTPCMVTLPNSRIPIVFSGGMGLNPDFSAVEEALTAPDLIVERAPAALVSFAQAIEAGQLFSEPDPEFDPALRECLKAAFGTP